jgi:hypothetical protein
MVATLFDKNQNNNTRVGKISKKVYNLEMVIFVMEGICLLNHYLSQKLKIVGKCEFNNKK